MCMPVGYTIEGLNLSQGTPLCQQASMHTSVNMPKADSDVSLIGLMLGQLDDTSHLGRKGRVFEEQAGVDQAPSMLSLNFHVTSCIHVLFQVVNCVIEREVWEVAIKIPTGMLPTSSVNALVI